MDATPAPTLGQTHQPLRDAVTAAIRDRITRGDYSPGSRLYEEMVARELGVSRNPIREAFQTLSAEGFVVIEPRRGARVATIDDARAQEIFEVRSALEGLVGELAAERCTPDDAEHLRALVEAGQVAVDAGDLSPLPHLNSQFHELLTTIAGNELLAATLSQLAAMVRWIYSGRLARRVRDSWNEHAVLVDAIVAGDRLAARQAAIAHVESARAAYFDPRHWTQRTTS